MDVDNLRARRRACARHLRQRRSGRAARLCHSASRGLRSCDRPQSVMPSSSMWVRSVGRWLHSPTHSTNLIPSSDMARVGRSAGNGRRNPSLRRTRTCRNSRAGLVAYVCCASLVSPDSSCLQACSMASVAPADLGEILPSFRPGTVAFVDLKLRGGDLLPRLHPEFTVECAGMSAKCFLHPLPSFLPRARRDAGHPWPPFAVRAVPGARGNRPRPMNLNDRLSPSHELVNHLGPRHFSLVVGRWITLLG
jgi:hypothetical protein